MAIRAIDSAADSDITHTGFELGWDHARHGCTPPPEHLSTASPVRQGWEAGRASFGTRVRMPSASSHLWLQLRLQAWLRGRAFDLLTTTPNYLGQLATRCCPVTRLALTCGEMLPPHGVPSDAVISRICDDAAYAAGNLATVSLATDVAKADLAWDDALVCAHALQASGEDAMDGLDAQAWQRLGVLMSFVTPLPHAQAAALPLQVLPPNRLHLLNPIQGLQALVTQWLLHSGWSSRLYRLQTLLPNAALAEDLQRFFMALLVRSSAPGERQPAGLLQRRWALEDAWQDAEVLQLWQCFARQLDAADVQTLLSNATADGLTSQRVLVHSDEQAIDGWQLETRGYFHASRENGSRHGLVRPLSPLLALPIAQLHCHPC